MDVHRFDHLVRSFAQPRTRRWTFGALAVVLGIVPRARPAGAVNCKDADDDWLGCGPACNNRPDDICRCYDPTTMYCADANTGAVCDIGNVLCREVNYTSCKAPGALCCANGRYCVTQCCKDDEQCVGRADGYHCEGPSDPCPHGVLCGASHICCLAGQQCVDGACHDPVDPDPCDPERSGAAAAGICCNAATEIACGDQCCSKEDQCCGGGANTTCCPKSKTCCTGANGTTCCDKADTFCCSGTCCASHRVCVGELAGICQEECPEGRPQCGRTCCTSDQYCLDATTATCANKCQSDETPCGKACCNRQQQCKDGQCVAKCANGQQACGTSCCGQNQQCKDGQCVKKKRRANKKKHGHH